MTTEELKELAQRISGLGPEEIATLNEFLTAYGCNLKISESEKTVEERPEESGETTPEEGR